MGEILFICVIVIVGLLIMAVKEAVKGENHYKKTAASSDAELISEYERLTNLIAAEAYAGSKCQGIGSNAAINATNNRIDEYRRKATTVANELEKRGYEVDRDRMDGKAIKMSSGKASVTKRAVAGAIIAGPAGAVIGAASAIDKNSKNSK